MRIIKLRKLPYKINGLNVVLDLGMKEYGNQGKRARYAIFKCTCGKEFERKVSAIKNKAIKTCGCRSRLVIKSHNLSRSRIYTMFSNMKSRCYNKNTPTYEYYKDISICEEWLLDRMKFIEWALENGYRDDLTIDRKNNTKGYSPDNCRFVDRFIQSRNTRKLQKNNTTGFRGVTFNKANNTFMASITAGGQKTVTLGSHISADKAAMAYDNYVIENNFEHTLNFPRALVL